MINLTYLLKLDYKDNKISVINRTGTAFIGTIICKLPKSTQKIPFKIESTSHFFNLFLRKKSRLKIESKNENLKHFIKNSGAFKTLDKIANKVDFNPTITLNSEDNEISTKYHLEFEDWTQVIEPIIAFYKDLADELEKRIANLGIEEYKKIS